MIRRLTGTIREKLSGLSSVDSRFAYKYEGKPVGLKTSGNYGELPVPCPGYFRWTNGPFDPFYVSVRVFSVFAFACACFGPLFLLPFWSKHKQALRAAAEEHGPTRYGQGKKDIL